MKYIVEGVEIVDVDDGGKNSKLHKVIGMNKTVTRIIVLITVFISAVIIFSISENKVNKDVTMTMEEATLPVMQFVYNDVVVNELHGYVQEMDMLSMRDGLMPIGNNRELEVEVMVHQDDHGGDFEH